MYLNTNAPWYFILIFACATQPCAHSLVSDCIMRSGLHARHAAIDCTDTRTQGHRGRRKDKEKVLQCNHNAHVRRSTVVKPSPDNVAGPVWLGRTAERSELWRSGWPWLAPSAGVAQRRSAVGISNIPFYVLSFVHYSFFNHLPPPRAIFGYWGRGYFSGLVEGMTQPLLDGSCLGLIVWGEYYKQD